MYAHVSFLIDSIHLGTLFSKLLDRRGTAIASGEKVYSSSSSVSSCMLEICLSFNTPP